MEAAEQSNLLLHSGHVEHVEPGAAVDGVPDSFLPADVREREVKLAAAVHEQLLEAAVVGEAEGQRALREQQHKCAP